MKPSEKWIARNARIARFAASVAIREDNPAHAPIINDFKNIRLKNLDYMREIEAQSERALAIAEAFDLNGPGLYVDKYLRNFLREYNGRVLKGEGANQPTSFNVMRAFVEPDENNLILRLLPERINSVSFGKILDYITDPKSNLNLSALSGHLDEMAIYELNMFGGYADFRLPGYEDFIFCGAAFVREQDELSIMSVFGRNVVEENDESSSALISEIDPKKQALIGDKTTLDMKRDDLFGDEDFQPIILLSRISLSEEKVQVRYVLDERKEGFLVWTDDPSVLDDIKTKYKDGDRVVERTVEGLTPYSEMFNVISLMPCFIFALDALEDDIIIERHPTALKANQSSTNIRKIRSKVGVADTPNYIDVRVLAEAENDPSSYVLPESGLSIDSSGYWKYLQLGAIGTDKYGRSVQGKTWVNKQESWFEIRNTNAASLGRPVRIDIGKAADEVSGYVYVMRSANHPKDVYKIGFTVKTPDERAAQLSSTSGKPDMFNVVQAWRVKNPREIEHHVHSILKEYRVNPGREFFKLKYRDIRSCIESVIDHANAMLEE